jgi:HSP20 family molecular chaperone IbpA
MFKEKRSFFERITGSVPYDEETSKEESTIPPLVKTKDSDYSEKAEEEGELSVDVYKTPTEVVVQSMIAGVRPEDLNISITREMMTIKGRREKPADISEEDYFQKELYWGSFSRTLVLPYEVEAEEAEAVEKHGLLTIRLPKIDKEKIQKIKVRSL